MFCVSKTLCCDAYATVIAYVITDALPRQPSVVVGRRVVISSNWKKSSACAASKQFNVPCPNHVLDNYRADLENYRAGAAQVFSQSFFYTTSEWFQSGLFKLLFYDGMLGIDLIVIAKTGMNLFKGSLYDFDCFTHDFLGQYAF